MQLTKNYLCYVTKDERNFAVYNINTGVAAGYALSEYASFTDDGMTYRVTVTKVNKDKTFQVDCKEVNNG